MLSKFLALVVCCVIGSANAAGTPCACGCVQTGQCSCQNCQQRPVIVPVQTSVPVQTQVRATYQAAPVRATYQAAPVRGFFQRLKARRHR